LALLGLSGCQSFDRHGPPEVLPPGESSPAASAASPIREEAPPEFVPRWVLASGEDFADTVQPLPPCPMPISDRFRQEMANMWTDAENYYTWPTLRNVALAVGGASILANTSLDQDVRDWYQGDVRGRSLDEFADVVRPIGDGRIAIPGCIAVGLLGALHDDTQWGSGLADFSARAGRAYGVGTPTLLLLQYGLGSARPGRCEDASYWKPFDHSNGASGHAFMGAVPFISAAQMTDDRCLKGLLYFCSTLPAWSRVNDDVHYLSQVWLGWWIAYLSCDAVNATQRKDDRLLIAPIASPEMLGATMMYRY
jgi:hypothetical protein